MKRCVRKFMFPCIETMLCVNGKIQYLSYHQKRFNATRAILFEKNHEITLSDTLNLPQNGTFITRMVYNKKILKIEFLPLIKRSFQSFYLVESALKYEFKYENRDEINSLKEQYSSFDDIIICENGFLKDTSIANIAINIKEKWYTPKKPLFKGVTRQRLLDNNFLIPADLDIDTLTNKTNFAIMNAVIGFVVINGFTCKRSV